jgi:hypothetical protein
VIYAYAQCNTSTTTYLDKTLEVVARSAEVTRVDAHLIDRLGSNHSYLGGEVYVGNDSSWATLLAQTIHNCGKCLALLATLRRKTNDRSTSSCYAHGLRYRLLDIGCRGVGHRLNGYRIITSNHYISDAYLVSTTTRKTI